jgi:hypothetical protein
MHSLFKLYTQPYLESINRPWMCRFSISKFGLLVDAHEK